MAKRQRLDPDYEYPLSYRLAEFLLGGGEALGDYSAGLGVQSKGATDVLEGWERQDIARDTLEERRQENTLKAEDRRTTLLEKAAAAAEKQRRREASSGLIGALGQGKGFEDALTGINPADLEPDVYKYVVEHYGAKAKPFQPPPKVSPGEGVWDPKTRQYGVPVPGEPKAPTTASRYDTTAKTWLEDNGYPVTPENVANKALELEQQFELRRSGVQGTQKHEPMDAPPPKVLPNLRGGPTAPAPPAPPSPGLPGFLRDLNPDFRDPGMLTGVPRGGSVDQAVRRDLQVSPSPLVPPPVPPTTAAPVPPRPPTPPQQAGVPPGPRPGETSHQREVREREESQIRVQREGIDYRDVKERNLLADKEQGQVNTLGEIITEYKRLVPIVNTSRFRGLVQNPTTLFLQSDPDVIAMNTLTKGYTAFIAKVAQREAGVLSNQDIARVEESVPNIYDGPAGAIKLAMLEKVYNKMVDNIARIRRGEPPLTDAPLENYGPKKGGTPGRSPLGGPASNIDLDAVNRELARRGIK